MPSRQQSSAARCSRQGLVAVVLALGLGAALACNSLLDVPVPSRIPADELEQPGNAALLVSGAISDFDCAVGAYNVMSGMLTDELEDATLTADRWVYDRRVITSADARYAVFDCTALGTYTPLNRARESADNVARLLNSWSDAQVANRTSLLATMAAYGAYARVLLGEMFCSAVISYLDENHNIVYGTELTPQQVFQSADSLFGIAIQDAQASGNTDILNMAYIGRARALLDLGRYDNAKSVAALVADPSYKHLVTTSSANARRENRIYDESNPQNGFSSSVGPRYRHMMVGQGPNAVPDPRVRVDSTSHTFRNGDPIFVQRKYASTGDPITIAGWAEAQLIIAEADARAGDLTTAIQIINDLRHRAGIPPTADYAPVNPTQADVLNQIIEERSRQFFLEGQRLGDVRRYGLALNPPPGAPYRNGGTYGPDGASTPQLCLPIPDAERQSNPNLGS